MAKLCHNLKITHISTTKFTKSGIYKWHWVSTTQKSGVIEDSAFSIHAANSICYIFTLNLIMNILRVYI